MGYKSRSNFALGLSLSEEEFNNIFNKNKKKKEKENEKSRTKTRRSN